MTGAFWKAFSMAAAAALAVSAVGTALLGRALVPPVPVRFATSAFSFDLPAGWRCGREGTEHVCQFGDPPYDAIVVMAMKLRGPADTLDAYEAHLRGQVTGGGGASRLLSLERRTSSGFDWVIGRRFGSEVDNWETTYVAGVTAELGILLTFSVGPTHRRGSVDDLSTMMRTIVVNQRALEPRRDVPSGGRGPT